MPFSPQALSRPNRTALRMRWWTERKLRPASAADRAMVRPTLSASSRSGADLANANTPGPVGNDGRASSPRVTIHLRSASRVGELLRQKHTFREDFVLSQLAVRQATFCMIRLGVGNDGEGSDRFLDVVDLWSIYLAVAGEIFSSNRPCGRRPAEPSDPTLTLLTSVVWRGKLQLLTG